MRVVFSAGEASGDAVAAALARELRARHPDVVLTGIGGRRLEATGATLIADSSRWGAISIAQSLRIATRAMRGYRTLKRELAAGDKGVFVPIDFGWMNVRLARFAKSQGWRVAYVMPPGSWRRDRQGADLPAVSDVIVTPFAWSAEMLRSMGADARWYGHPLKALLEEDAERETGRYVAVLPGSRDHEIAANLELVAEVAEGFGWPLLFALAPATDFDAVRARWARLRPERMEDRFLTDRTRPVLRGAEAALVCSGTATLEAALLNCPMVVMYALTPAMRREARLLRMKRPKFIALPNILLDRAAVPEHAERDGVDPNRVRADLEELLRDPNTRSDQLSAFAEIADLCGPGENFFTRSADAILSFGQENAP